MKNELRKTAKELRAKINCPEKSIAIKNNLYKLQEFKEAKNILCYSSFGSEVQTANYYSDKTKNWYLPKIEGENIKVCPFCDEFELNKFGIKEPCKNSIENVEIIDMIIIPALCADKSGYRIGYGKGYYDRFLKSLKHNPIKVILEYDELVYNSVYPDEYDEKADYIITDKKIYKI